MGFNGESLDMERHKLVPINDQGSNYLSPLSLCLFPQPFLRRNSSMSFIFNAFHDLALSSWDLSLSVVNFIIPARHEGKVTPEGHPGFGGKWPEFVPPKEGDSRCSCPALNAMANHGKSAIPVRTFSVYSSLCSQVFYLVMEKTFNSKKWANSSEQHITLLQPSVIPAQKLPRICSTRTTTKTLLISRN